MIAQGVGFGPMGGGGYVYDPVCFPLPHVQINILVPGPYSPSHDDETANVELFSLKIKAVLYLDI